MKRGSVVMLLEILIAAAIVVWLAQFMLKQYFKAAPVDAQTDQLMDSQGMSSTTPQTAIDTVHRALNQAEETQAQRLKELERQTEGQL